MNANDELIACLVIFTFAHYHQKNLCLPLCAAKHDDAVALPLPPRLFFQDLTIPTTRRAGSHGRRLSEGDAPTETGSGGQLLGTGVETAPSRWSDLCTWLPTSG